MPSKLHHLASATLAASLSLLPIYAHADQGGIQTDGTVGGEGFINQPQILSRPEDSNKINITENMGTRAGTNLFHSFSRFNINEGQTVTFTENTPNSLDIVIARVTGGEQSILHGLLESTPGGHANFYLINPAGVLFGKNARINVAGDLHVSTANQLRFANGGVFDANPANRNVLSADAPTAFGFTQSTVANNSLLKDAKLTIDGTQLGVKACKTLDLVGNKIEINNSQLSETSQLPENQTASPQALQNAIEIRLVAQNNNADVSLIRAANGYLPLPEQNPSAHTASNITITNSTLDVSGNGGGRIGMWGNDIAINGIGDIKSALLAGNNGDIPAAAAGGVQIWGNSISLTNSNVVINAEGQGSTGNLNVTAMQDLTINGNANLELSANEAVPAIGQGGGITLKAGRDLTLDGGASVNLISNSSLGGGDLLVEAVRNIRLHGSANMSIESKNNLAGELLIFAGKNLAITDRSHINSFSFGAGDMAALKLSAKGDITLNTGGSLFTETNGTGSAGPVEIKAGGDVVIDGQVAGKSAPAQISTGTGSSGAAGAIWVQASGDFILRNGGGIASNTEGQHPGGNIDIQAQNILLEGKISSASAQVGDGGNIALMSDDLVALCKANISTRVTGSSGSGGNITITGNTLLLQSSSITADTSAKAHGGNIKLDLKSIIADYLAIGENASGLQNTGTQGFSRISAAAPLGVSGLISFTSPQLNLSGVLMGFGGSQFLATGLDSNACGRNGGSSLSRGGLGIMGLGLVANE